MSLHCSSTLSQLVEESGCSLEHPKAAVFRGHVLAGEWEEVSSWQATCEDWGVLAYCFSHTHNTISIMYHSPP